MKTHWHDQNPWRDTVVYVPIERLAECVAGGTIQIGLEGPTVQYDVAYVLAHWAKYGDKLDAYILPQPGGRHCIGVRFGAGDSEYLSPYNANPEITESLLRDSI